MSSSSVLLSTLSHVLLYSLFGLLSSISARDQNCERWVRRRGLALLGAAIARLLSEPAYPLSPILGQNRQVLQVYQAIPIQVSRLLPGRRQPLCRLRGKIEVIDGPIIVQVGQQRPAVRGDARLARAAKGSHIGAKVDTPVVARVAWHAHRLVAQRAARIACIHAWAGHVVVGPRLALRIPAPTLALK